MNIFLLSALLPLLLPLAVHAQHPHRHGQMQPGAPSQTEARSLTPQEVEGYLEGRGMGLARVAELNHYPGPLHVLELADALELSEDPRRDAQEARTRMLQEAVALGSEIVEKEKELDALFRAGTAGGDEVHALLLEIGRLKAELRFVHIRAHLEMREVLTPEQIRRYDQLRGNPPD